MLTRAVFVAACFAALSAVASGDRPQSIMFDDSEDLSHLTSRPASSNEKQDHCAELARQVEALKGRPQRRYAAAQRFEAECKR